MQITVPPGVVPGMTFAVNTPTGQMQVTCPDGAVSGSPMLVNVPAPPVNVPAPPVVVAVAQPMMAQSEMVQPVMAQPIMGAPMVQEMMRAPQAGVSGTVVNFCVSDCTVGDEFDDHRYWLAKDGLSAEVVPPALEAAGMSHQAPQPTPFGHN